MDAPVPVDASPLNEPARIADFLRDARRVRTEAAWAGIAPPFCDLIERAAGELLQRPERLDDLVRCADALCGAGGWDGAAWRDTPRDDSAGERFFFILPLLQHLAPMRAAYAARGIPDDVLRDTLSDFQIWIDTNRARTGSPGFREAGWLREHVRCRLYRLGRLQFQPSVSAMPFVVLAHRRRGEVCVVVRGAFRVTADGRFADSEGASGPVLETVFREEAGEIRLAHRVRSDGFIAAEPTAFEPGGWEPRLAPGDPVLALHIPAGEPLAFDACRESFRKADAFFPRHFADLPAPRGVTCGSWLFYPGFCDILPATSNIVRFQRAFLRVPVPGATADQTYERAFSPHGRSVTRGQLATTLQRRLFDHIAEGHVPVNAGALFPAPLGNWGSSP